MKGPSLLARYLEAEKISAAEFADRIGTFRGTVGRWLKGTRIPTIESAWKIERATKGAVRVTDWYPDKP